MAKMRQNLGLGTGLLLLACCCAGCSGKAIAGDSAGAGGSAEASGGARAYGGWGPVAAGAASKQPGAGNAAASGTSGAGANASAAGGASPGAGGTSGAGANASTAGGASANAGGAGRAGGAGGTGVENPLPGTPLIPLDGWIAAESNALLIRGAVFSFADSSSKLDMTTNFSGSNACIQGSTAKIDLTCTPVAPATDCYGMFFGAAIGLNLNQRLDPVTMMAAEPASYNAGRLRGFAFDLTGSNVPSPKDLRFQVESSSQQFCNLPTHKLMSGTNVVLFSELVTECFRTTSSELRPTAETAASALVRISWHVLTNTANEVPYDFCVSNIRALSK